MADVITRFRLESTQYDSKLREAAKGLAEFSHRASLAGSEFGKFTQKNAEAARSFGSVATSATNVKDKVKELVAAYNDAARAYNALTTEQQNTDWAKGLSDSLTQLKGRIAEAKKEMQSMQSTGSVGSGLFGGGKLDNMLSVFGGNLMTKGASMLVGLGEEMAGMVRQGVELAKQGEGIRIAFERLGRGDILNGLREATHGTVTDLELMKAAVKFNDFKLPLDELGTMLAFAQQKAKDSGQSVDYMVDSIVTGLGRKSLMILDNLGLSANEVKEKMKETGDMTKAVGEIIREQMAKAGDYVETAADRAAQANVSLQNKMEELGRKFAPVEEASNQLWTSIKIGILDIVGGPLATLLNQLTEAGRLKNALNNINGNSDNGPTKVDRMVSMLGNGQSAKSRNTYQRQLNVFDERIERQKFRIASLSGDDAITRGMRKRAETELKALKAMRDEYVSRANDIFNPKVINKHPKTGGSGSGSGSGSKTTKADLEEINGLIPEAEAKVKSIQEQIRQSWDEGRIEELNGELVKAQEELKRLQDLGKPIDFDKLFPMKNLENDRTSMPSLSMFDKAVESARTTLSDRNIEIDQESINSLLEVAVQYGLDELQPDFESLQETMAEGMNIPDEAFANLQEKINERLEKMGIDPIKIDLETGKIKGNKGKNEKESDDKKDSFADVSGRLMDGVYGMVGSLNQLGIEIPEGLSDILGAVDAVLGVLQAINTIVEAIEAMQTVGSFLGIFARGGIVHAAQGFSGTVPGMSYSGDNIPIMANAGEVVLTRAQAGVIADAVSGGGGGGGVLYTEVSGDALRIVLDRSSRKRSKGTYMTTKMKN